MRKVYLKGIKIKLPFMDKCFIILGLLLIVACGEKSAPVNADAPPFSYQHPIPFAPESYVCYRNPAPVKIDGKMEEKSWQEAPWTNDFVDIEGDLKPKPALRTRCKMLWDEHYFYFFAEMEEPHIWGKLTDRDAIIYYDDDFEIFIDPDGDGHNYYELEVNALNTFWDLLLLRPYRVDQQPKVLFNWNIPDIKTAVHIEGSLNDPSDEDEYWSVEIAIPWAALKEFAPEKRRPKSGEQWRVNFSRVDWTMEHSTGRYEKVKDPKSGKNLPENNWVWSPTGRINMHMPEQWGYVQFSGFEAGIGKEVFEAKPDEQVKWALWQLYFQQLEYFKEHDSYTDDLNRFSVPIVKNETCIFEPIIYTTPQWFEIVAASCKGEAKWRMRADGKLERLKPET